MFEGPGVDVSERRNLQKSYVQVQGSTSPNVAISRSLMCK